MRLTIDIDRDRLRCWLTNAVLAALLVLLVLGPYFRARLVKRLTGTDVGYWDASSSVLIVKVEGKP